MTINDWYSRVPVEIAKGGTNASSMSTVNGIEKFDGTRLVTSTTALIDGANIMTNTSQPAFLAYANTQANVLGDGTFYTVIFANTVFDQTSSFDGVSTFTAPKTGKYMIGCTIALGATFVVTNDEFGLYFVTTPETYAMDTCNPYNCSSASNFYKSSNSMIVPLSAGDTVSILTFASGLAKTIDIEQVSLTHRNCTFWGYLVC